MLGGTIEDLGRRQHANRISATAILLMLAVSAFPIEFGFSTPVSASTMAPAQNVKGSSTYPVSSGALQPVNLTLVTGDQVTVFMNRTTGQVANFIFKSVLSKSFSAFIRDGDQYLVPSAANLTKFNAMFFDLTYMADNALARQSRMILQLNGTVSLSKLKSSLSAAPQANLSVKMFSFGDDRLAFLDPPSSVASTLYKEMLADPLIESVSPDFVSQQMSAPADNGGLYLVNAVTAWSNLHVNGSGIKIAILDTGIYAGSPDFFFPNGTSKIILSTNFSDDNSTTDYFGHGTHVAGIAAGTGLASDGAFVGVAPGASLMNVKVLDQTGSGYDSWVMEGIYYAVQHGANIISMSLGGPSYPPLDEEVNWAVSHGVLVVVAAGNSGPSFWSIGSPAEASRALTVGADAEPNWQGAPSLESLASFSSMGPGFANITIKPDVVAPGWNIISDRAPDTYLDSIYPAYPGYNGDYMVLSGTSMATPFVAGAAALVMQAHPNWNVSMVESALESSAQVISRSWTPGLFMSPDSEGTGRIDVADAITASAIFQPGVVNVGKIQNESASSSVVLTNPTMSSEDLKLVPSFIDVSSGQNETQLVALSSNDVTIPPLSSVRIGITVNAGLASSSVYAGYVFAYNAENTSQLVAHAAMGFNGLHYLSAVFDNSKGKPVQNLLVIPGLINSTWFEQSFEQSYVQSLQPFVTNAQGRISLPGFAGTNILFTTEDFGSAPVFIQRAIDISNANVTITIGSGGLIPIRFDPGQSNITIYEEGAVNSVNYANNGIGAPGCGSTPCPSQYYFSFGTLFEFPTNSTVFTTPSATNSSIGVYCQYGSKTEIKNTGAPQSANDLYTPLFVDHNVSSPITNTVNLAGLVVAPTDYYTPATSYSTVNLALYPVFRITSFVSFGFGFFMDLAVPRTVDQYLAPQTLYEQVYYFALPPFNGIIESFQTGLPATSFNDQAGLEPFQRPSTIGAFQAGGTSVVWVTSYPIMSGPPDFAVAYPPGAHYVTDGTETASVFLNGSLFYQDAETSPAVESYAFYVGGPTQVRIETTGDVPWGGLSTQLSDTYTFVANGSSGSITNWHPGVNISRFSPLNLNLRNEVPPGQVAADFYASWSQAYASNLSSVSVQYSTNGVTWNPASALDLQSSVTTSGTVHNSYRVILGNFNPGEYVSVRIQAADSSGGTTDWSVSNAFLVGATPTTTTASCNLPSILGASTICFATIAGFFPTGTVSWSQTGTGRLYLSSSSCTLSSTRCEVAVTGLAVGPVALTATYSGDLNNLRSSGTLDFTVGSVVVTCTNPSPVVGSSITCKAMVAGFSPTGDVTWSTSSSGKFSALMCTLSKKNSCSVKYIPTSANSTVTITASYPGDTHNQASSGTFSLAVTQATSTTRVSCSPRSVVAGSTKTIKCTAKVNGYSPTGTVTWSPSGTGSIAFATTNTCALTEGSCFVTMTATGAGSVAIQSAYGGDGNNTSSSGIASLTIKQAKTSLSLSCSLRTTDVWTCTATLKGSYLAAGENISWSQTGGKGVVTFSPSNTCSLAPGSSSTMICSVTVDGTSKGAVAIEAVYLGDSNNLGSHATKGLTVK